MKYEEQETGKRIMSDLRIIREAILSGDNDLVRHMVDEEPSLASGITDDGLSLLTLAAYHGNREALEIIRGEKQEFDLFEAAILGDNHTIRKRLDAFPAAIHSFSPDGFTALGLAVCFGQADTVRLLLSRGADANVPYGHPDRVAPLHSASRLGSLDLVRMLVEAGADVNATTDTGDTALKIAMYGRFEHVANYLQRKGAKP